MVERKKKRWKGHRGKQEVKRRRAHRQEAAERRLLCENRTAECGAGIGLDLGNDNTGTGGTATTGTTAIRKCECGSTAHLRTTSKLCRLNKHNLAGPPLCCETKEGEEEIVITTAEMQGESCQTADTQIKALSWHKACCVQSCVSVCKTCALF